MDEQESRQSSTANLSRRTLLGAAGGGLIASALGSVASATSEIDRSSPANVVRWGFVGTGLIANNMAAVTRIAPHAALAAVSSRKMETAQEFAKKHDAGRAFDSWQDMVSWDGIDAIYVATPTSVREEICVAAARKGKHVLGEKPFASLASVKRITAACRDNDVAFMDGTHFVHHPRTADIKANTSSRVGWPWSVHSAFQFNLTNRNNIRFNPDLEPLGAIGDVGWYNMRAAFEYLSAEVELRSVSAYLRRDTETSAAISGSGVLVFDDGSTSTWNCGFDSGAVVKDLRISGTEGSISLDNFVSEDGDNSASYSYRQGSQGPGAINEEVRIESTLPGAALMFEDFAKLVHDASLRAQSMHATERTQQLLDAIWNDAVKNERRSAGRK